MMGANTRSSAWGDAVQHADLDGDGAAVNVAHAQQDDGVQHGPGPAVVAAGGALGPARGAVVERAQEAAVRVALHKKPAEGF